MTYVVTEKNGDMFLEKWTQKERPLMKCGHTANATTTLNNKTIHCCVICDGANSKLIADKPNLKGRKAKCLDCGEIVDSDFNLAFFEYRPNEKFDLYYSGCYGWD